MAADSVNVNGGGGLVGARLLCSISILLARYTEQEVMMIPQASPPENECTKQAGLQLCSSAQHHESLQDISCQEQAFHRAEWV